jgi:SAM-dependent methyltransferase
MPTEPTAAKPAPGASPAAAIWDPVAPAWADRADLVDRQKAEATARMLALAGIRDGHAVLDLAAGPGGAGLAAVPLVGPSGRIVLSDGAPAMVELAARRAAALPQVSTRVLDLEALDVPDASFDAVLCRQGLMFAADPAVAAREAARVLRPGGRLAVAVWGAREANPWLGLLLDAVSAQLGMPIPPPGVAGPFALGDAGVLAAVMGGAGLTDVRVETVGAPLRVPSLDAWWDRVPALAGPLGLLLAGMEPAAREAIRERATAAVAARARPADDGGLELDGSILVAAGRRPAEHRA